MSDKTYWVGLIERVHRHAQITRTGTPQQVQAVINAHRASSQHALYGNVFEAVTNQPPPSLSVIRELQLLQQVAAELVQALQHSYHLNCQRVGAGKQVDPRLIDQRNHFFMAITNAISALLSSRTAAAGQASTAPLLAQQCVQSQLLLHLPSAAEAVLQQLEPSQQAMHVATTIFATPEQQNGGGSSSSSSSSSSGAAAISNGQQAQAQQQYSLEFKRIVVAMHLAGAVSNLCCQLSSMWPGSGGILSSKDAHKLAAPAAQLIVALLKSLNPFVHRFAACSEPLISQSLSELPEKINGLGALYMELTQRQVSYLSGQPDALTAPFTSDLATSPYFMHLVLLLLHMQLRPVLAVGATVGSSGSSSSAIEQALQQHAAALLTPLNLLGNATWAAICNHSVSKRLIRDSSPADTLQVLQLLLDHNFMAAYDAELACSAQLNSSKGPSQHSVVMRLQVTLPVVLLHFANSCSSGGSSSSGSTGSGSSSSSGSSSDLELSAAAVALKLYQVWEKMERNLPLPPGGSKHMVLTSLAAIIALTVQLLQKQVAPTLGSSSSSSTAGSSSSKGVSCGLYSSHKQVQMVNTLLQLLTCAVPPGSRLCTSPDYKAAARREWQRQLQPVAAAVEACTRGILAPAWSCAAAAAAAGGTGSAGVPAAAAAAEQAAASLTHFILYACYRSKVSSTDDEVVAVGTLMQAARAPAAAAAAAGDASGSSSDTAASGSSRVSSNAAGPFQLFSLLLTVVKLLLVGSHSSSSSSSSSSNIMKFYFIEGSLLEIIAEAASSVAVAHGANINLSLGNERQQQQQQQQQQRVTPWLVLLARCLMLQSRQLAGYVQRLATAAGAAADAADAGPAGPHTLLTEAAVTDAVYPLNVTDAVYPLNVTDAVYPLNVTDAVYPLNVTDAVYPLNAVCRKMRRATAALEMMLQRLYQPNGSDNGAAAKTGSRSDIRAAAPTAAAAAAAAVAAPAGAATPAAAAAAAAAAGGAGAAACQPMALLAAAPGSVAAAGAASTYQLEQCLKQLQQLQQPLAAAETLLDLASDTYHCGCSSSSTSSIETGANGGCCNGSGSDSGSGRSIGSTDGSHESQIRKYMSAIRDLDEEHALAATELCSVAQCPAETLKVLQQSFIAQLPQQVEAAAAAVCAQLPISCCCNNPSCTNLAQESELQLVGGKACICGGCRIARYCSSECQTRHWQQHKAVCKRIKWQRGQAADAQ